MTILLVRRADGTTNSILQMNFRIHEESLQNLKERSKKRGSTFQCYLNCDPARARTEDPKIKSLLLYQLSYGVSVNSRCKDTRKIILQEDFSGYICPPKWEHSSAGLEHLPYKQRVRGSIPCAPTQQGQGFQVKLEPFFVWHLHSFLLSKSESHV